MPYLLPQHPGITYLPTVPFSTIFFAFCHAGRRDCLCRTVFRSAGSTSPITGRSPPPGSLPVPSPVAAGYCCGGCVLGVADGSVLGVVLPYFLVVGVERWWRTTGNNGCIGQAADGRQGGRSGKHQRTVRAAILHACRLCGLLPGLFPAMFSTFEFPGFLLPPSSAVLLFCNQRIPARFSTDSPEPPAGACSLYQCPTCSGPLVLCFARCGAFRTTNTVGCAAQTFTLDIADGVRSYRHPAPDSFYSDSVFPRRISTVDYRHRRATFDHWRPSFSALPVPLASGVGYWLLYRALYVYTTSGRSPASISTVLRPAAAYLSELCVACCAAVRNTFLLSACW
jgi:hypothetical protein